MRAILAATMAGAAALATGTACAMTSDEPKAPVCRVIDGEKLPADSGGADALCKAIAAAVAEHAPGVEYSVEITVLANTQLKASVTTRDGRKLADRNFARMDRPITEDAFQRFARTIAEDLARTGAGNS